MHSPDPPILDWWQEMVRKWEEEELAAYVFADRLKLTSMSFSQHDNHLRNAAHYDKLLKSYALELSKAREIAPETLEGLSETERLWVFEIQRMECYESEMAIRRAGIDTIKQCLGRYTSKEQFNEYALEKVKSYRAAAENLRSKKPPKYSPTARPGPITRLPPELLRMILKDCCAEPTVAKAARVCREWHQIAVPLLYNSVDLGEGVELEMWVINGNEYRGYREGREKSDARIAPMSLSIRLLHTLRTTPYVRYVRKLSYRGLAPHSKSALERWPNSSIKEYYGETGSVNNTMLTKLRTRTINSMVGEAKKVSRLLVYLENLELCGKTDFRIFDAFLGALKWRPLRQLTLRNINIRACHFDRRPTDYSITVLTLENVLYYFGKEKRRRLGSSEANRLSKIRGTEKIYSLLRKCPGLKSLCITDCDFDMEHLLECRVFKLPERPAIYFPNLSHLQIYSSLDTPTWDYHFRNQIHWFISRHPAIESLSCSAGLLSRLTCGVSSFPKNPDLAIMPQILKRIEIDQLFLGMETDQNGDLQEGFINMKESLPYVFQMMPLLEELQFRNFPWGRNYFRRCLQGLRNSPRLKTLRFLELYWEITLPILQDLAKLSPLLENVTLECDGIRVFDEDRNDDYERFDVKKLVQTLSPLRNLHDLSINYSIEPTTPAIFTALSPFPIDPRLCYLFRVFENLRKSDPRAFEEVCDEYVTVISDVVSTFAKSFVKLDYLNLAVWESAQFLDGNEFTLLRVDGVDGRERKCIGWRQVLRGVRKLDVLLEDAKGVEVCNIVER